MTWQNPIAWLGLAALAVPVLVHLLARRTTRRLPFPTLRFIDPSRLTPARRRQLTDLPLLALRIAAVTAAVAALAQPWLTTASRSEAADARLSRAIVIDTGPGMSRPGGDGRSGVDRARAELAVLAADAVDAQRVIEHDDPGAGLGSAAAWLGTQGGRRELIVFSDFAVGSLTDADVQPLDETIGLQVRRVETEPAASATATYRAGRTTTTTTAFVENDETGVTWETQPAGEGEDDAITIRASDDEARAIASLAGVVRPMSPLTFAAIGPMAIVTPGAPDHAGLAETITAITEPWMFDVALAVRRDLAVIAAAQNAEYIGTAGPPAGSMPVATTSSGDVVVWAGVASADGRERLTFMMQVDAMSDLTAAVLAALPARSDDPPFRVLESSRVSQTALDGWARPATPVPAAPGEADGSDGRWLWLLALVLLAAEGILRRTKPAAAETAATEAYARVA